VRDHGRTRIKRVPVVRRVVVHPGTTFVTTTTPGGVHVVRQRVLRYVPVVTKRVVTIHGKTRTLTETRIVPTVRTQTQTQVQTQTSVVTNQQTVVNQVTVVDRRTETVVQPVTVVQTETETVTETRTVTAPPETVVITVTLPAITVTDPGGG
jgi:hypothetical protein